MFVRTLLRKADTKRVVVRDGLVVEHHIKFAGLPIETDDNDEIRNDGRGKSKTEVCVAPSKSIPTEYTFLRDQIVLPEYVLGVGKIAKFNGKALFDKFCEWLARSKTTAKYKTNTTNFGINLSSLCNVKCNDHMDGCTKERKSEGIVYTFDIDALVVEMVKRAWFIDSAIPMRMGV